MVIKLQMSLHRWQKVASYLNASVTELAGLDSCVDHEEVWRGALVIREKKVGPFDCCVQTQFVSQKVLHFDSFFKKLSGWLDRILIPK